MRSSSGLSAAAMRAVLLSSVAVLAANASAGAPPARAATLTVTSLADSGPGTLREAIAAANAAPGPDVIDFALAGDVLLASPLPPVTDPEGLVIQGAGVVAIDGGDVVRPFSVAASGSLVVAHLTVRRGFADGGSGGAFLNEGSLLLRGSTVRENAATVAGGAIANHGRLVVEDSTVEGNSAPVGGAIHSTGSLDVSDSQINGNSAEQQGGAINSTGPLSVRRSSFTGNQVQPGTGGAIEADTTNGSATISESQFLQNISYGGGAVRNRRGALTIDRSTFTDNETFRRRRVSYPGGAVANVEGGKLTVLSSTLEANSASLDGGGIHHSGASLVVANSTISGNLAANGQGGGISVWGPATMVHVTIAGNTALVEPGGGLYHDAAAGTLTLTNSLIANNAATGGPDCASTGSITAGGPNLVKDMAGCSFGGPPPLVAPPLLGPLAANGGPTRTHALLKGSPAIDAADQAACAAPPVGSLDQRGAARPAGAGCDLGAYEGVSPPGPLLNGDFEAGGLGWTFNGAHGGIARVETEGTCFGANNTLGITFPGRHALNVRSSPAAPTDSVGMAVSDVFRIGSALTFRALSENDDAAPEPAPVTFDVLLLDPDGKELRLESVRAHVLTTSPGTSNDGCLVGEARNAPFSIHTVDTSAFAGEIGRVAFRQHTNVPGKGFFTLVDDVQVME